MVSSSNSSIQSSSQTQAELDLLETVLFGDDVAYPWNLGECEALDESLALGDLLKVDDLNLGDRSPIFFDQLDSCMVYAQLCERFGSQVPDSLLKTLSQLVQQRSSQPQSLLDRLVGSVCELLPQWSTEDLQVLARPFAHAMRGETPDYRVGDRPWDELSSLEQARLSLAIAYVALKTVNSE